MIILSLQYFVYCVLIGIEKFELVDFYRGSLVKQLRVHISELGPSFAHIGKHLSHLTIESNRFNPAEPALERQIGGGGFPGIFFTVVEPTQDRFIAILPLGS